MYDARDLPQTCASFVLCHSFSTADRTCDRVSTPGSGHHRIRKAHRPARARERNDRPKRPHKLAGDVERQRLDVELVCVGARDHVLNFGAVFGRLGLGAFFGRLDLR
jgi:hypothetical protein